MLLPKTMKISLWQSLKSKWLSHHTLKRQWSYPWSSSELVSLLTWWCDIFQSWDRQSIIQWGISLMSNTMTFERLTESMCCYRHFYDSFHLALLYDDFAMLCGTAVHTFIFKRVPERPYSWVVTAQDIYLQCPCFKTGEGPLLHVISLSPFVSCWFLWNQFSNKKGKNAPLPPKKFYTT